VPSKSKPDSGRYVSGETLTETSLNPAAEPEL
jgi:hypothetical protein